MGGEEEQPLLAPPSFDCCATCYSLVKNVRHYFSWRQVDTHINNLYNTTFWALVLKSGLKRQEEADELEVCLSYIFYIFPRLQEGRVSINYQVGTG